MVMHLFWQAPWLVKLCVLFLMGMSLVSWVMMLAMLRTLLPALRTLKRRWEEASPPRMSASHAYDPWVSIASHSLQAQLNMLATIAKLSPYVGLLGTVFGMMDALKGLATASSMPIQQLAPGISEALVTTALGLLVAIPAMFFYQILAARLQELQDYLLLEAQR